MLQFTHDKTKFNTERGAFTVNFFMGALSHSLKFPRELNSIIASYLPAPEYFSLRDAMPYLNGFFSFKYPPSSSGYSKEGVYRIEIGFNDTFLSFYNPSPAHSPVRGLNILGLFENINSLDEKCLSGDFERQFQGLFYRGHDLSSRFRGERTQEAGLVDYYTGDPDYLSPQWPKVTPHPNSISAGKKEKYLYPYSIETEEGKVIEPGTRWSERVISKVDFTIKISEFRPVYTLIEMLNVIYFDGLETTSASCVIS